jgi:ankyrin repeat protein
MNIPKDIYEYLMNFVDNKTVFIMLSVNKKFHNEYSFQKVIRRKYPLLIGFKKETWKELFLRMSYYIAKLGILGIPYISTKGYNPENFYKNYRNNKDIFNTAMGYAAEGGQMEIVKLMIEKGATKFNLAMMSASYGGQMEIVKLMIEKGATYFNTAMYESAKGGKIEIVKFMIEKGATEFNLAMMSAAYGGQMEIVKLMIEKGATDFNTAMKEAGEEGQMEIVNYLKNYI